SKAELGLLQRPATVFGFQRDGTARHRNLAAGILALCGNRDPLGADITCQLQVETASAPAAECRLEGAAAVGHLSIGRQPADEQRAIVDPGGTDRAIDRRTPLSEEPTGLDRGLIDGNR